MLELPFVGKSVKFRSLVWLGSDMALQSGSVDAPLVGVGGIVRRYPSGGVRFGGRLSVRLPAPGPSLPMERRRASSATDRALFSCTVRMYVHLYMLSAVYGAVGAAGPARRLAVVVGRRRRYVSGSSAAPVRFLLACLLLPVYCD